MRATIVLKAVKGQQEGRVFELDRHDMFVFGRSEDCQCSIPDDPYISSNHFLLEVNPPDAELRDLGSKNGTHVNGRRCGGRERGETPEEGAGRSQAVALRHGDRIKAGKTEFEVELRVFEECGNCREEVRVCAPHDEARGPFLCERCSAAMPKEPGRFTQFLAGALEPLKPEEPVRFPGYSVQAEIDEGGMGKVYLGRREADGRVVAIKCVKVHGRRAAKKQVELFSREMKVTMDLKHPNIVEFFEEGRTADGGLFFAMEYCEGGSVSDLMDKAGSLSLERAGRIMLEALEGLSFAHAKEIVHRDLKPHNILLAGKGEDAAAKVADFGLAKNFILAGLSGMTASGQRGGTLAFMPKEQLKDFRGARPASDVFSMGATLYHMLTNRLVYDLDSERDACAAILKDRLIPIRKRGVELPDAVAAVVDKATVPDWKDRYQTAGEFKEALARALE
ncbi:MAG: protein kinase [Elusimicrobia bacterium]|nr:protein kinase [Elusimicrobiota bacterium]